MSLHMTSWKRPSLLHPHLLNTPVVVMAFLLLGPSLADAQTKTIQNSPPPQGEATLPGEALAVQLLSGDVAAARKGFKTLLDSSVAKLKTARNPESGAELLRELTQLSKLVLTLQSWETAEVHAHAKGIAPSEEVVRDLFAGVDVVFHKLDELNSLAAALVPDGDDATWRRIRRANKNSAVLGRQSLIFFRNTRFADKRKQFLATLKNYLSLPETLQEFDAQHPDAAKAFGVRKEKRSAAGPSPTASRLLTPEDHAVEALVTHYFSFMLSGDLQSIRTLFSEEAWPGEEPFRKATTQYTSWRLKDFGQIYIRPLGSDEFELSAHQVTLVNAAGESKLTGKHLIVRLLGEEYKIVYLGTEDSRERNLEHDDD